MSARGLPMETKVLVREIMNSPVITVGARERVDKMAKRMSSLGIGSLIVVKGGNHLGMVTDTDIVSKVVAKDLKPSRTTAMKIMSKPLHTIESSMEVTAVAKEMRKLKIKRLGVTEKGKLVGVVSISDLASVTPELVAVVSEKARIMSGIPSKKTEAVNGYCDSCGQWSDFLAEIDSRFICIECRTGTTQEEVQ